MTISSSSACFASPIVVPTAVRGPAGVCIVALHLPECRGENSIGVFGCGLMAGDLIPEYGGFEYKNEVLDFLKLSSICREGPLGKHLPTD